MSASFELDREARIVRSRAWGVLVDRDLLDHRDAMEALFERGELDGSWGQLCEFQDVTEMQVTTPCIERMAWSNPWPKACRRALVAPRDLVYGLARMYEMKSGELGQNVRVFRSLEQALAWLGDLEGRKTLDME
ncbi:MAG: hypothetical protein M5U26_00805 [Planctomycetota bacterium]|nr:hypothetical protein [Planctomycetota bacterium]